MCAHFHPCSNFVDQFCSRLTAFKPHKEVCKPQCSSPHKEGVQPKIKNYQSPHCEKEGSMAFLFMRHLWIYPWIHSLYPGTDNASAINQVSLPCSQNRLSDLELEIHPLHSQYCYNLSFSKMAILLTFSRQTTEEPSVNCQQRLKEHVLTSWVSSIKQMHFPDLQEGLPVGTNANSCEFT